jgi:predicted flap endonuclease-1-like 5' DNA nuclease
MASLTTIEGIGEAGAAKLAKASVGSTATLIARGATPAGRRDLSKASGVTEKRLLEWVNRADLMRISGVGGQYSDLLEASGVDSVAELAKRKPANLAEAMAALNAKKKLVRQLPTDARVADWVAQAKKLPKVVKH